MVQNRRFARIRPSGLISSAGKIAIDNKSPLIDCSIVDYGAGGVCLQVNPGITLPKRFELIHGKTRKKCRVAWVAGRKVGVAFQ
ncbi:MAG: PilZ domain-containing protein [Xanthobacteraceae bacterium]|nr:PilZ domain-containing protein [Xanthobacteraceae bacterium]